MNLIDQLRRSPRREAPPTRSEQWQLVGAGALLVAGVFLDGFAHTNLIDELEGFITPWHGVIFAGYLACLVVVLQAGRRRNPGEPLATIPAGWHSALVGAGMFALGFVGDGIWHSLFGIEADIEALLSPTHLLMLAGALLVLSAPVGSQWRSPGASSWRELGPTLTAVTLIVSLVSFFLVWTWPVRNGLALASWRDFATQDTNAEFLLELGQQAAMAAYVVFAIVLVAPVLLLSRRWRLPAGSVVLMTLVPWVGMSAAFMSFFAWQRLLPVAAAAVVVDVMVRRPNATPHAVRTWRMIGLLFPLLVVALDMLVIQLVWGLGWPPEFVTGSALFVGMVGLGISLLVYPPAPSSLVSSST